MALRLMVRSPKSLAVNLATQIKRFSAEARRYVDDESVSQPAPLTKEEYETQLREAGNTVMKLAGMLSAQELKPEQTAATLIPFFNERLLKSNLIPILARVQAEGALRAKHRIPPDFPMSQHLRRTAMCRTGGKPSSLRVAQRAARVVIRSIRP